MKQYLFDDHGIKPGCAEPGKFAEANKVNGWDFNEWLHGKTSE